MAISQDNLQINSQENSDETAAVLAFATKLQEGLLPKQPQTQEKGAGSDLKQEPKIDLEANNKEIEKTMDSKLDELRKEIKGTIKEEISSLKESIQEALNEDE